MTLFASPSVPVSRQRLFAALSQLLARARRRQSIAELSLDQRKDAGIAWELAGYGRGADVSMLAITILQSQR